MKKLILIYLTCMSWLVVYPQCNTDIGTSTASFNGSGVSFGTPIYLCEGDEFTIQATGYSLPPAVDGEVAELFYAIYQCTPSASNTPEDDACWSTFFWTADNFTDANDNNSTIIGALSERGVFYYFAPVTVDDGDNNDNPNDAIGIDNDNDFCWDFNVNIFQPVAYLNPIEFEVVRECGGEVEIQITGGKPEVTGADYSISNTGGGAAVSTAVSHNETITITGLGKDDVYALSVVDGTNCPATFSGVYSGLSPGEDGTVKVCETGSSISLFPQLEGAPDAGGTWSTPSNGASNGTMDPTSDQAGDYTYTITATAECPATSAKVTVEIEQMPDAGTDGTLSICSNDNASDLFTQLGGSPVAGGSWTTPASATHSGSYDPANDVSGDYTYSVFGDVCVSVPSTSKVTVTETVAPNPGGDGTHALCETDAAFDLIDFLTDNPDTGGSWTDPSSAVFGGSFDPSADTEGIYTYTVDGTGPCVDQTATVTVSIERLPDAGENGTLDICSNDAATDLFNSLEGTPATGGSWVDPSSTTHSGSYDPSSDDSGIFTYTVVGILCVANPVSATVTVSEILAPNPGENSSTIVCENEPQFNLQTVLGGTPDNGGTWTDPSSGNSDGTFTAATDVEGDYTYTVSGTGPCLDQSAAVTVSIEELPDAGEDGAITLCGNDSPVTLFDNVGGTPETDGSWTNPSSVAHTGSYDPLVDDEGIYTYTVNGDVCAGESDQSIVTVTEIVPPNPGENNTIALCESDDDQNLTNLLSGTPDAGGSWTNPSGTVVSETFDPSSLVEGTFTYSVAGNAPCEDDAATLEISISTVPDPGEDGTIELCDNDPSFELDGLLGGTPESGGVWTNPSGTVITSTVDPGSSASGSYTYTVSNAPCEDESAIIDVTINASPIVDAGNDVTIQPGETHQINAVVTGEDGFTWSPSASLSDPSSKSPVASPDESTTYTLTATTNEGCEKEDAITVLVKGQLLIPTGFTPNNDGTNDEWEIENIEFFPNAEIKVYSRWGNLVYNAVGSQPFWDGNSLGMKVPEATYWYVITTNDTDYPDPIQGTVSIFR